MINTIRNIIYKRFSISFSKSGEDVQLFKMLGARNGLYVDVGCWHPVKASNTYYLYLRGWNGICVDPNPELRVPFKKIRKRDLFINCAVGDKVGEMKYYMLGSKNESMNSSDRKFIEDLGLAYDIRRTVIVPVRPLYKILDEYLTNGNKPDIFDIDVEGDDLSVIRSNDWAKYRPKIVMIESSTPLIEEQNGSIYSFMSSVQYELIGKSVINKHLGNLMFIEKNLL
jgi:FkbM family methyltransferase